MKSKCKHCGIEFEYAFPKSGKELVYCGINCRRKADYKNHPEQAKETARKYYEKNKDKLKAANAIRFKEWYAKNREKQIAYVKNWILEHPDKLKEYKAKGRLKQNAESAQ